MWDCYDYYLLEDILSSNVFILYETYLFFSLELDLALSFYLYSESSSLKIYSFILFLYFWIDSLLFEIESGVLVLYFYEGWSPKFINYRFCVCDLLLISLYFMKISSSSTPLVRDSLYFCRTPSLGFTFLATSPFVKLVYIITICFISGINPLLVSNSLFLLC